MHILKGIIAFPLNPKKKWVKKGTSIAFLPAKLTNMQKSQQDESEAKHLLLSELMGLLPPACYGLEA